jgi:hypothetical protein
MGERNITAITHQQSPLLIPARLNVCAHVSSLVDRYENIKKEIGEIDYDRLERNAKRENIEAFISTLEQSKDLLKEFDEELWITTADSVTVHSEHDITFTFKDGFELAWKI